MKSTGVLALALVFISSSNFCTASWFQSNTDCGASNYVDFSGKTFTTGWNYIAAWDEYKKVAVARDGSLFLVADNDNERITAVSAQGKTLWKSEPMGIFKDFVDLLYNPASSSVIVSQILPNNTQGVLYNIDSQTGKTRWKKMYPEIQSRTRMSLSTVTNAVYLASRDNQSLVAFNLKDGSVMWKKTGQVLNVTMRQPMGVSCDGKILFLPTNTNREETPQLARKSNIVAFAADTGNQLWSVQTNFSEDGNLACSNNILFGTVGTMSPGEDSIFAINIADGSLLWRIPSLCKCSFEVATSGPVADKDGNAYYSCGNQVYSVDANGNKRWSSKIFGSETYNTCDAYNPSIHPSGYVYFVHSKNTEMYALSTKDGSLVSTYTAEDRIFISPPALVGKELLYVGEGADFSMTVESIKPME